LTDACLAAEHWGEPDYEDRMWEMMEMGDYAAVDAALVAALGAVVLFEGRELDMRALLAGRRVEVVRRPGRCRTRGWTRIEVEA